MLLTLGVKIEPQVKEPPVSRTWVESIAVGYQLPLKSTAAVVSICAAGLLVASRLGEPWNSVS